MATTEQVLAAARAEIGYTESPPGSNCTKFAKEAGHAGCQPWCATFLAAIARRLGLELPSNSAYTPTMANGFKAVGKWSTSPAVGAFAFFDFPDSKYRIQHVGVIESFDATTVTTIDGNTSSTSAGSDDNGGGVFRRRRSRKYVVGYGMPAYAATPTSIVVANHEEDNVQTVFIQVPLDENGNGWKDVEGLPVAVSKQGPYPPADVKTVPSTATEEQKREAAYWLSQSATDIAMQPHDGKTIVVVRGGKPKGSQGVYVTVSR